MQEGCHPPLPRFRQFLDDVLSRQHAGAEFPAVLVGIDGFLVAQFEDVSAFWRRWMYWSIISSSFSTLSIQSSSIVSGRPPKMSNLSCMRRDSTWYTFSSWVS